MALDLSVVIATYNGADVLPAQLEALAAQRGIGPFEVVIADNGSVDATRDVASTFASELPSLRVVDASAERGQGFARNAGAQAVESDKIVFLDQDDVICAGYLAAMRRALDVHPMVGARIDHESLNPGWISSSRRPAQVGSLGNALGFLPYAGGQTLGIRKDVFDAVGGFDPTMPGAVEDVDLCWRVQLAGWELSYVPDAVVQYRYRPTLREQMRQAYAYGRAEATLYRWYRSAGMQRRRNGEALKSWLVWAKRVVLARNKGDVAKLGWKLAHDVGMARACIQFRIFYP